MTVASFDHLEIPEKKELLYKCCGSKTWVNFMIDLMPFEDLVDVLEDAEQVWYNCDQADWLEAFSQHPKIGDTNNMKEAFPATAEIAASEQSGMNNASGYIHTEISELNKKYQDKHGFIFIIYASGRSAEILLQSLITRINNDTETELELAAEEQNKITRSRLEKLFI